MAVGSKGTTFATDDQVTALKLNNLVDNMTFAAGAVDDSTTQLSSGAIIVKDGGVTPAKLSTGAPTWTSAGDVTINGASADNIAIDMAVNDASLVLSGGTSESAGAHIQLYGGSHATAADDIYIDADTHLARTQSGTEICRIVNGVYSFGTTSTDPVGDNSGSGKMALGSGASGGAFNYFNASDTCMKLGRSSDGSIINFFRNTGSPATEVGSVSVTTTATAYNTSSDYRLKENIEPLTGAIERLLRLSPSRFSFKSDKDSTMVDGFIAHEVEEVVPEAVTGEKNGEEMQQMDASKLVPLLASALQEQIAITKKLETRIEQLEGAK